MTLPLFYGGQTFCLHTGIGPPSGAGSIGAAAATYVPANPTIRINILIARCMDCSPCVRVPWERKPSRAGIIPLPASISTLVTYPNWLPVRLGCEETLEKTKFVFMIQWDRGIPIMGRKPNRFCHKSFLTVFVGY